MLVKLLTEHHLELLSLKGGCKGSSESTHVKMPHCWKSHALARLYLSIVHACWMYNCQTVGLSLSYFSYLSTDGSDESVHTRLLDDATSTQ